MRLDKYKIIFLDFDGVTVDSIPFWYDCPTLFLKELNIKPKDDVNSKIKIFTSLESASFLHTEYNLGTDAFELRKQMLDFVLRNYKYCPIKNGIIEFLEFLKENNKKVYLLSHTALDHISSSIYYHKLENYFEYFDSCYECERNKSNGLIFKDVLEKNKIDLKEAIVIDDSLSIVKNTNQLGIDVISIQDKFNMKDEEELKNNSLAYIKTTELIKYLKSNE